MDRKPIVTRFHLLALGILIALGATTYFKVPAALSFPVHWGLDGHPDQTWSHSTAALLFPAIGVLLTALFAIVGLAVAPKRIELGRPVAEAILTGFLGLLGALQLSLILIGIGSDIDLTRLIAFAVALALIGLGLALTRAAPNAYAGVRLPWAMANKRNWVATHRLTGLLMVLAGAGLGMVAFAWPDPINLFEALGVAVLLPLLLGMLFSAIMGLAL
jgi:uncharacterized membrane protein